MWGEEQQGVFVKLKEVLKLPDHYNPYILMTNWSQRGMGAVLSQLDP